MTLASGQPRRADSSSSTPPDCPLDQLPERGRHPLEPRDGHTGRDEGTKHVARRIVSAFELQVDAPPPAVAFGARSNTPRPPGRDEFCEPLVIRLERPHSVARTHQRLAKRRRRSLSGNTPAVHHHDAIAELERFFGSMRRDEDRTAATGRELFAQKGPERMRSG